MKISETISVQRMNVHNSITTNYSGVKTSLPGSGYKRSYTHIICRCRSLMIVGSCHIPLSCWVSGSMFAQIQVLYIRNIQNSPTQGILRIDLKEPIQHFSLFCTTSQTKDAPLATCGAPGAPVVMRKNTFLDDVLEDSSPESTHHVDLVASVVGTCWHRFWHVFKG